MEETPIEKLSRRVLKLETDVAANTALTRKVHDNTTELVTAFNAVKGGIQVLEWMAKPVKASMVLLAGWAAFKLFLSDHLANFRWWR